MTPTCEIQWVNASGVATPDQHLSIGRVRTMARVDQIAGRGVRIEASRFFHICAEHAARLTEPGMEIWEWEARATPHMMEIIGFVRALATGEYDPALIVPRARALLGRRS